MENIAFNPWHQVDLGEEQPDVLQAIVEIPKGTKGKYELDKRSGMLRLDRVLHASTYYPANYGLLPRTLGEDHDPLDIVVLSQIAIQPMCLVRARVVGVMRMIDNNEADDKIIAVAADDVSVGDLHCIGDLPEYLHAELRQFFEEYKKLENKSVLVEEFQDAATAKEIIQTSIEHYKREFASMPQRMDGVRQMARWLAIHGNIPLEGHVK